MSEASHPSTPPKAKPAQISDGIAKGIIGFVIGAGVSFLGMHFYGPREKFDVPSDVPAQAASPPPGGAAPGGGMGGAAAGGAMTPPAGGMGAPGGGMGGAAGKRNLTALVGKLELLSRDKLNLHLTFDGEQAQKISAELANLESAKTLTDEEAQSRLEALEASLTPEQKETIDAIGLPRPPGGGPGAGGGMGAAAPDANPFVQETNEKRLKDLLERLKSTSPEKAKSAD